MRKIKKFPENFNWFVKKRIPIKAVQITKKSQVKTLEGTMVGKRGDWLLEGINGELYFCDNDIFNKSYEKYVKDVKKSETLYIKHKEFLQWYFGDNIENYHPAIEILKSRGVISLNSLIKKSFYIPLSLIINTEIIPNKYIEEGPNNEGKIINQPTNNYNLEIVIKK